MDQPVCRPSNEAERLLRLHALEILDTDPEPIFDALARTALQVCQTPIALITLVDADRQWFKSNIGLDRVREIPRNIGFCSHTILQRDLMEIADTQQDARFLDDPLVTGAPHVRFYAGAPIVMSGGETIGSLCVIGQDPKILCPIQRATLFNLAAVAATTLEMRQRALEMDRLNAESLAHVQEIQNKNALYHAIVEDQSDLISLAKPSGELTFVNRAYAEHFGLKPHEMIGRNLLEYVAAEDREAVAAHLRDVCRRPGIGYSENLMHSSSGVEHRVAWTNLAIGDEHGKVITLHSVGRDITERKRAEIALQASREHFRAVYESTPAMLHSIDATGRLLFVSDVWLKKMGYARDEVIGRFSSSFLTPSSREYAMSVVLPAFFESGRCDAVKYQMVRKDGSIMDVQLSAVLERDEHGQPLHSLAVLQDVTEENMISATLQANEERLALATSVNQIGIWEIDLQSGRLTWNDTMFKIFGGSRSDFRGILADWEDKLHPQDREPMKRILRNAIAKQEPIDCDFRIVRESGEIRHINSRAIVIADAQKRPVRVLGTNYDISERKEIEQALAKSERRLRLIANKLPVLISHMDTQFRYTFINNKYRQWFGFEDSDVIGKTVVEVFGPSLFAQIEHHLLKALSGGDVSYELAATIMGSPRNLSVHHIPDRNNDGVTFGLFTMVLDVTEQKQAQAQLEDSERQLRAVTDNLPVLIAYVDTQERLRFVNRTFEDWLDLGRQQAIGKPLPEVIGPQPYEELRLPLQRALRGERIDFDIESKINGVLRHLHNTYVPDTRADGTTQGIFALGTDVTLLKQVEQEMRNLARVDPLTGLPNRRQFDEKLGQALARSRAAGHELALMFLDIDHFKSINDAYGHGTGDLVLCEFAKRIRAGVRASDTVARLAGDEFVIIVEDCLAPDDVEIMAKKLIEQVRAPMDADGINIRMSTSVGIALHQTGNIAPSDLLAHADRALYRAKAAGRNGFATYRGVEFDGV
ncbi:MAG: PAS domain S-box protein [Bordetella sp.]|uniref:PAS domain S-box protein n=1 Tax=Bordetella sp. TaxID=28081 RepID=UPI003F7C86F4